jgi:RNA polymerase sigma factor for flagellar operon FliA
MEIEVQSLKDHMIEENMPFVHMIAKYQYQRLKGLVEMDELISWGTLGLIDAVKKYDPSKQNQFKTYAEWRIRGAILDGLRSEDQTSRHHRDQGKAVEKAKRTFELKNGRRPSRDELAGLLDVKPDRLDDMRVISQEITFVPADIQHDLNSLNDCRLTPEDRKAMTSACLRASDMESKIEAMQKLELLCQSADSISRAFVWLYFVWGLTMIEIAECFGVTESRVSQRLKQVMQTKNKRQTFIERLRAGNA